MSTILKIDNLTVDSILNNITLFLEEEKSYILIGKGGKTTLAKSIMGINKYRGNIYYKNELVTSKNKREIVKNMGYFRSNMLKKEYVMDNIIYPLINLGIGEIDSKRRIYDIANKFKINDLLLKKVGDLTYTEKKMVSFITSVIHNPKLLIIDESLEDLDNFNRNKIFEFIKENKITCIYISNNEEEIVYFDNIIIMNDGKLVDSGETKSILEDDKKFKNIGLPFLADLSHKLKVYEIINNIYLNEDEMIDNIWK